MEFKVGFVVQNRRYHVICYSYLAEKEASKIHLEIISMKGLEQGIKKFPIAKPPVTITHLKFRVGRKEEGILESVHSACCTVAQEGQQLLLPEQCSMSLLPTPFLGPYDNHSSIEL